MSTVPKIEKVRAVDEHERGAGTTRPSMPPLAAEVFSSPSFAAPQRTYSTGWPTLDELIAGGVKARQLTTIAAPTGAGKTALVTTIAVYWAKELKVPILWVTTELDNEEQTARFATVVCHQAGIPTTPDDFLSGRMTARRGAESIAGLPIYLLNLDDPSGDPFDTIFETANAIHTATGQRPIVIDDYMQAHAVEDEAQRRVSVTKVSTRLRRLARQLNTAVVAISSVSRAYYGKAKKSQECEDPIDWLAAAKESGDVEYSSAVFLYLDTSEKADVIGEAPARLVVAKSRRGSRGFVGLRFHGPSGAFREAPESVAVMAPPSKFDERAGIARRVLDHVRRHQVDPLTKSKMREAISGVRATAVDAAIESLIEQGEIKVSTISYLNSSKQTRKKDVLVIVDPEMSDAE